MRDYININQVKAVQFFPSLDLIDMAIMDYLLKFKEWADQKVIKDHVFFWVSNQKIIDDMPLIGIKSKRGINQRIEKLVKCGILEKSDQCKKLRKTWIRFDGQKIRPLFETELGTVVPSTRNDGSQGLGVTVPSTRNDGSQDSLLLDSKLKDRKDPVTAGKNPAGDDFFNLDLSKKEETLSDEDMDQVRKDLEHLKPPEKPKEKSCAKKEKNLIEKTLEYFQVSYKSKFGRPYIGTDADYKHIKLFIEKHKIEFPGFKDPDRYLKLSWFITKCMEVNDPWLIKNISPAFLNSQYNRYRQVTEGVEENVKHYTYDQAAKIVLDSGRVGETFELLFERIQPESGTAYYLKNY